MLTETIRCFAPCLAPLAASLAPAQAQVQATGWHGLTYDHDFTPDGDRIVCRYQFNAASPHKLQSVKTTGFPVSQAVLFVPNAGHTIGISRISPDSQWVVYEDYVSSSNVSLNAIPTSGGASVGFGFGTDPAITPDSQRVIYSFAPGGHSDVLSTQIFGGSLRNLSRAGSLDYATGAQISPNGQWVVFQLQLNDANGTYGYQLRASDGSDAPVVFNLYLPAVRK